MSVCRKSYLISIFVLFFSLLGNAQELSVSAFRVLETDMDARINYPIKDQNGKTCAIIKMVNPNEGFHFDTGTLQIIKTERHTGEYWIYVQAGVKKLTISHDNLGVLRDYIFPIAIEEATSYELKLESGTITTIVNKDVGGQFLTIKVTPAKSIVYIDDVSQSVSEDGEVSVLLPYGSHTYRAESANYKSETGIVNIGNERTSLTIDLKSTLATLSVTCPLPNASLVINEQIKGIVPWSGSLPAGMYLLEVKLDGYRTYQETIILEEQDNRSISVPELQSIYGSLYVNYKPVDATIYIDNENVGLSPEIFNKLSAGPHYIKIEKKGYETAYDTIVINETKQVIIEGNLEKIKNNDLINDIHPKAPHKEVKAKDSRLSLTPLVGCNLSDYRGEGLGGIMTPTFTGGLELGYNNRNKTTGISFGLMYSNQGCKVYDEGDFRIGYVNSPIHVWHKLFKCLGVKVGIQPGYLVSNSYEYYNQVDVAVLGGVFFDFNNIIINAQYNYGLIQVALNTDAYNSVIQFTIGYRFNL